MDSPAHHTQTLSVWHPQLITALDVDVILSFCNVESLDVITSGWRDGWTPLAPSHRLSPVFRSLYLSFVSLPNSEIFDLICSFSLLEDVTLVSLGYRHRDKQWDAPPTSPRLNRSLKIDTALEGI